MSLPNLICKTPRSLYEPAFQIFPLQVLAKPGYGEDVRSHGFVPFESEPLKHHTAASAPSSPLKMADQRWVFPPPIQRNFDKAFHSGDHSSPRTGKCI